MYMSDTISDLVTALVAAKKNFNMLIKRGFNPHFKNRFADLSDINEATQKALLEQGLVVCQSIGRAEGGVLVSCRLLHTSGQFIDSGEAFFPSPRFDAQGCGSAATYGRRYQLSALLCLSAEHDDDAETTSAPTSGASRAKQVKTKTTDDFL